MTSQILRIPTQKQWRKYLYLQERSSVQNESLGQFQSNPEIDELQVCVGGGELCML